MKQPGRPGISIAVRSAAWLSSRHSSRHPLLRICCSKHPSATQLTVQPCRASEDEKGGNGMVHPEQQGRALRCT